MATFVQSFKILDAVQPLAASASASQQIGTVSTVQVYPLGTRVKAVDPVFGVSEFLYCSGIASTVAGDIVYIHGDFVTLRDTGTNGKGRVGVATAATVASTWGWYCVQGRCLVNIAGDVTALTAYAVDATAGVVDDAIVATNHLLGMSLQLGLAVGGSAIAGTTDTTPANQTSAYLANPFVALAV
jgi:hypothetical protein